METRLINDDEDEYETESEFDFDMETNKIDYDLRNKSN
jgi:hypothetical protein